MNSTNIITAIQNIFKESTEVFFLVTNPKGIIVSANNLFSARLKLNPKENSLKNFINDFHNLINSIEIAKVKTVIKTLKTATFEILVGSKNYKFIITPHLSTDNTTEFITIMGFPIQFAEESVVELKSTISSQNKQNSDLLELIEKLSLQNIELTKRNDILNEELINKDKFFSILSHDLRGQMGNMINSSDLLVESFETLDIEDRRNIIRMLNKSIRKNYNLLDNLLLWASFERGKIKLHNESINLKEIINNSLSSLTNEILKKKIVLVNSVTSEITAYCDLKYLQMILIGVLSNAIKFSYTKGKIQISNNIIDDKFSEIIITDYGVGMDSTTLNDLLKIDKIHSNYGTEKETGSGMGLLVANRIIEEMGGKLTIITEPNNGTTVRIPYKRC